MLPLLTLVLGGAASGKSREAEKLILNSGLQPVYIATAETRDAEMRAKVDQHIARRGGNWMTIETPIEIGHVLSDISSSQAALLDCATMWLSNVMLSGADLETAQADLLSALAASAGPVVVVSNEVGSGIVPDNALARHFRVAQGRLNIALAEQADCVVHVLAGLPQIRKGAIE